MRVLAITILSLFLTVPAFTGCSSPEEPAVDAAPAAAAGDTAGGSAKKEGSDSK